MKPRASIRWRLLQSVLICFNLGLIFYEVHREWFSRGPWVTTLIVFGSVLLTIIVGMNILVLCGADIPEDPPEDPVAPHQERE